MTISKSFWNRTFVNRNQNIKISKIIKPSAILQVTGSKQLLKQADGAQPVGTVGWIKNFHMQCDAKISVADLPALHSSTHFLFSIVAQHRKVVASKWRRFTACKSFSVSDCNCRSSTFAAFSVRFLFHVANHISTWCFWEKGVVSSESPWVLSLNKWFDRFDQLENWFLGESKFLSLVAVSVRCRLSSTWTELIFPHLSGENHECSAPTLRLLLWFPWGVCGWDFLWST